MDFDMRVKALGFGLAVAVEHANGHPVEERLKSATKGQLLSVAREASSGSTLEEMVVEAILRDFSFEEVLNMRRHIAQNLVEEKCLLRTKGSFRQWEQAVDDSHRYDKVVVILAIRRMSEQAKTLSECFSAWRRARSANLFDVEASVFKRMQSTRGTAREFLEILRYVGLFGGESLDRMVSKWALKVVEGDYSEWSALWERVADTDKRLAAWALRRMKESASTFEQWLDLYDKLPEGHKFRTQAIFEMLDKAKTFGEWLAVWKCHPNMFSSFAPEALGKMNEVEVDLETLLDTICDEECDEHVKAVVLGRLNGIQTSLHEWLEIYNNKDMPSEVRDIAFRRLAELCR